MSKEELIKVWKDTYSLFNEEFEDSPDNSFLVDANVKPISTFIPTTEIEVVNQNCIDVTQELVQCDYKPCLLNFASAKNPGGGVIKGSSAQEEEICRRSNLFFYLVAYSDKARDYGIVPKEPVYGLNTGWIIYTPQVIFIKDKNYKLSFEPFCADVISCSALNRNQPEPRNGWEKETKRRMRNIFRIAYNNGCDSLVLGAWGCGVFKNPPEEMAKWWHEVILEPEFQNKFKNITFAILNDKNSVSNNYEIFKKEFE